MPSSLRKRWPGAASRSPRSTHPSSAGRHQHRAAAGALGLGHAVWSAPAASLATSPSRWVLLPDDLMVGEPGCLKQMVEAYADLGGNLICTEEVAAEDTHKYGIVTPGTSSGRSPRSGAGREAGKPTSRRRGLPSSAATSSSPR